ncbi:hypothetical protein QDX21_03335 [Auritidibacter ignavus]|uniref:Uncharacterized protein n=1 Tax=Auritidibacter ignavus TaxID=678932 RepID=A0AAJ6AKD6_9MICC|nr:hypothetical protein [Auritidibacter ignavus]WGH91420.1 hypothetical protein QDX23_03375 [Auritidibacter ignavus]WGH93844.1 hypothetical protein QDX21_03335 [Auritidibacter ignavus]
MRPVTKKVLKTVGVLIASPLLALAIMHAMVSQTSYGWVPETVLSYIILSGVLASLPLVLLWDTHDYDL